VHQLLEAAERRAEHEWRQLAQLAVWIMQPWVKKKLKVEHLIKLPKRPVRRLDG
jgi:hypothetical protein